MHARCRALDAFLTPRRVTDSAYSAWAEDELRDAAVVLCRMTAAKGRFAWAPMQRLIWHLLLRGGACLRHRSVLLPIPARHSCLDCLILISSLLADVRPRRGRRSCARRRVYAARDQAPPPRRIAVSEGRPERAVALEFEYATFDGVRFRIANDGFIDETAHRLHRLTAALHWALSTFTEPPQEGRRWRVPESRRGRVSDMRSRRPASVTIKRVPRKTKDLRDTRGGPGRPLPSPRISALLDVSRSHLSTPRVSEPIRRLYET